MSRIKLDAEKIYIDGVPTKIMSGAMHYFRVMPEYWEDRLLKLKELGCNCVETYVCWNCHEDEEGKFDFSGGLNLGKFLDLAKKMGLYAVVRPGPYICSEWDFGGLPWWLLKYDGIKLRSSDPLFLSKCSPYLKKVCKILKSRQIDKGGNIIAVQIENEYGSYGNDKAYLKWLRDLYIKCGLTCPFITSDGETEYLLKNGALDGVWASVNYRNESERCIKSLEKYHGGFPPAVMELWNGRAQHWGEKFIRRDIDEVAESVRTALKYAEFVNLYMYHGGTSFGFKNGAENYGNKFVAQMTSYDVDAPVNEYGVRTPKYYAEQKAICESLSLPIVNTAKDPEFFSYDLTAEGVCPLDETLSKKRESIFCKNMEEYDQGYGYIGYKVKFFVGEKGGELLLPEVHDAGQVYINGEYIKTVYRNDENKGIKIENRGEYEAYIFVENWGRTNYGAYLADKKGLVGDVLFYDAEYGVKTVLSGFIVYSFDMKKLPETYYNNVYKDKPCFYKYSFTADKVGDTILKLGGFNRGVAFINGFNLGRHFSYEESENKLFVPAPLIKSGRNEIVVFDAFATDNGKSISLTDKI